MCPVKMPLPEGPSAVVTASPPPFPCGHAIPVRSTGRTCKTGAGEARPSVDACRDSPCKRSDRQVRFPRAFPGSAASLPWLRNLKGILPGPEAGGGEGANVH